MSAGSVTIRARVHPALIGLVPEPVPAAEALPPWLRAMPSEVESPRLGGATVRTMKHCPPLIDAFSLGLLIPLACDLRVSRDETGPVIAWDWPFPVVPDQLLSRSPLGAHVPEQAGGAALALGPRLALKFMNFWTLAAPEGWSILYTHPLNREDLPFRTLSGVVDADRFGDGLTHFPAIWTDEAFEGVLPRGTPVAQAIPLPRTPLSLDAGTQTASESVATRLLQEALAAERGVYRKRFRAKR